MKSVWLSIRKSMQFRHPVRIRIGGCAPLRSSEDGKGGRRCQPLLSCVTGEVMKYLHNVCSRHLLFDFMPYSGRAVSCVLSRPESDRHRGHKDAGKDLLDSVEYATRQSFHATERASSGSCVASN
eukprot:512439-Amphidinium_carterae.2